ncbi:hypothetical protein [Geothrix sp. PMB-07]|uniref:hypothetical protein n=1 Tax=Geothrix sp. PMB-07 TaxID=3068640 RepID=UPI002741569D|nr:hypothetical protein [Geothrix sp. PMB-07]WLT32298.1 hypothetical protein Q9293_02985 [Geothrix sp. PMB-07]
MRAASAFLQQALQAVARHLPTLPCPPLQAAQTELRRSLHLAFGLAAAHRRAVVVTPFQRSSGACVAVQLPAGVQWGRPKAIPLPPSLAGSGWRGGKPRPITVTPERQALANVWFLHHGRQALCLRLGLTGSMELLRYRPLLGAWVTC